MKRHQEICKTERKELLSQNENILHLKFHKITKNSYSSSQKWSLTRYYYGYFLAILFISLQETTQGGLIDSILYHKYRPLIASLDPMNSSSSSNVEHFEVQSGQTANIEYQSPINRIMELIRHHNSQPIIVVSQSSKDSEPMKQANVETNGVSESNQWTFLNHQGSNGQPIQYTVPSAAQIESPSFEQIYLSPTSTGVPEQQVSMLPSQLNFSPVSSLYSSLATPTQHYGMPVESRFHQHQQVQQPQTEPQPIFLASYVPELSSKPLNQQQPHINWLNLAQTSTNSQQPSVNIASKIEQSIARSSPQASQQQLPQQVSSIKANSSVVDTSDDSELETTDPEQSPQKEQPKKAKEPEDNDIEEPKPVSKVAKKDEDTEEPSSGSSTYEDKYDSDSPDESNRSNPSAQSSSNVINGLVKAGLNDDCLQCICRASSGCDHQLGCITRGAEEKYCGPFQLTEEYWQKAGSPGDATNNFSAFEDCANDMDCAVETISNYMQKYRKDCDNDGLHTCMDYARLHKLKSDECDNTEKLANNFDAYWAKFQTCASGYNRSRTADDEEI